MQPIPHSWISASNCHSDYPTCMTKNVRHCIDSQFRDGAWSMSLLFLRITVANISKKKQQTEVNIVRPSVGYLNSTIYRKTLKPEREIRTDVFGQIRQHPRLDWYLYGFGLAGSNKSGCGTGLEPHEAIFVVNTQIANRLPQTVGNTRSISKKLRPSTYLHFSGFMNHLNNCFHYWHCASGSHKGLSLPHRNDIPLQQFNRQISLMWNKVGYRDSHYGSLPICHCLVYMPHNSSWGKFKVLFLFCCCLEDQFRSTSFNLQQLKLWISFTRQSAIP